MTKEQYSDRMNILFYTSFEVSPQKGGTERITDTLSRLFREQYGFKCFLIYHIAIDNHFTKTFFDKKLQLEADKIVSQISEFIQDNKIDIILVQEIFHTFLQVRKAIARSSCKLVFVHHFAPGAEIQLLSFSSFVNEIRGRRENNKLSDIMRLGFYPLIKLKHIVSTTLNYHSVYEHADRIVLLSERFIPVFQKFGRITGNEKFRVIPNLLSFDSFLSFNELQNKAKEVLIVSRLEERFKRISLALKIWQLVEHSGYVPDWKLSIVGHGCDEGKYKKMVGQLRLKHVTFYGTCQPEKFYRRAAIFMMTSSSEGWGLTLTEAQQMGCVPLAFDTYLSLHDIIEDGKTGYIIPCDNMNEYACKLLKLMQNDQLRCMMARQGIESSKRFAKEKVILQWFSLIDEL